MRHGPRPGRAPARYAGRWLAAAAALALLAAPAVSEKGVRGILEGNPFRGRTLFVDKLCNQCHSVWGHGDFSGPEIAQVVAGKSLPQLAGEFWNHTPRMIDEMRERGHEWPTLDREEMANILSYLYYLRLFDDPGSASRGAAAFARLRCESCHALGGRGGTVGGPLDRFSTYTSPVPLAEAMWNAGPAMQRAQIGRGSPIPEFSGGEMADLQAHIRESGLRPEGQRVQLLPLPDPVSGERVFRTKRCGSCHAGARAGTPDLGAATMRLTVAEISGVLWNHRYAMHDRMAAAGIPFPLFQGQEFADLIAYLHLLAYEGRAGDPVRGARVFREKGCATCHEGQLVQTPDLAGTHSGDDVIGLSAAMWNHAPAMHRAMAEHDVSWPHFEEGEVEDIVAYLRRLSAMETPKSP
jgi:cytochrome c2